MLHYFHTFTVHDRVGFSNVSDVQVPPDTSSIDLLDLPPTAAEQLEENLYIELFIVYNNVCIYNAAYVRVHTS